MEKAGANNLDLPLLFQVPTSDDRRAATFFQKVRVESTKLWQIVGPAIFARTTSYAMTVITQAFAGHLGDLELAAMSIAGNVIIGFNFGLMLGMASALETLCGQAFGAKRHHMLGIYLQRSMIVIFLCAILVSPMYLYATPILRWTGQPEELAVLAGTVSIWCIPAHISFVFILPLTRFLQCQLKNLVNAVVAGLGLVVHVVITWVCVYKLKFGLFGTAMTLNFSWWFVVAITFGYVCCGGCPLSWHGFSMLAFSDLCHFIKLSTASGVMICLENWYYRILILLTGNLRNAEVAVDAISICMSINSLELMIPMAFFAGTGVRVANELGAGNGKAARFATIISVAFSFTIGLLFCILIIIFRNQYAFIFSSSSEVVRLVPQLSYLLAFTVLLNSVQPILSGVAVGSGWQSVVAVVNIGSYYIVGLPLGVFLGWVFDLRVKGIWAGMIGGTLIQTLILTYITVRCDWDKEAVAASLSVERWSIQI